MLAKNDSDHVWGEDEFGAAVTWLRLEKPQLRDFFSNVPVVEELSQGTAAEKSKAGPSRKVEERVLCK